MTAALQVPMISIKRVDNLQSVWVDVCNWIDAALDHPAGLLSSRDVYHAVLDGRMDLHVIRGGDAIHAVIVTEFVSGSRGRGLSVVAIGGRHMDEWLADAGLVADGVRADTKHPNGWRIEVDASTDLGDIPSYYPK